MITFLTTVSQRHSWDRQLTCKVPWGFRKLLSYIHDNYTAEAGIPIIITENGFAPQGEGNLPLRKALRDVQRQDYFAGYLRELFDAIVNDGIKVDGYIAWALTE